MFVGGSVGGGARYATGVLWVSPAGSFPLPILTVNLTGAFLLGIVLGVAGRMGPSRYVRPLLGTGFCGGFTTFSSVVVTSAQLVAAGHGTVAGAYLGANLAGGLAAGWLGVVLARGLYGGHRVGRRD